jgi:glycosyltransferase involved in cell wall biosynthesis
MSIAISVIIPAYNVENYIADTLQSICNQTFKNFEIIIVDDGSADNSVKVIKTVLQGQDIRWQLIEQENRGQATARNIGIEHAIGEWIICPDSDDIVNESFLMRLYNAAVHFNASIAFCNFQVVGDKDKMKKPVYDLGDKLIGKAEILENFLERRIQLIAPAILVKKDFLLKMRISYNENYRFTEDLIYVWETLFASDRVAYVNSPLYNYLRRPNSIMTSSGEERILAGRNGIKALSEKLLVMYPEYDRITQKILSRWTLGALRAAARIYDFKRFKGLCNRVGYRDLIHEMFMFPDIRAKVLALSLIPGCGTFYLLIKAIDR